MYWAGPRNGPIHTREEVETADLIVLGDSRVYRGIVVERLEEAGLGRVASLWSFGGEITTLLDAVREFRPRRLVLNLTPVGLHSRKNPVMTEIMREPPPSLEGEGGPARVAAWAASEREHLHSLGLPKKMIERDVQSTVDRLEQGVLRSSWSSARVDLELNEWFDLHRPRVVTTLSTRTWKDSWTWILNPSRSEPTYRVLMSSKFDANRAASLERMAVQVRELQSDGWEIVCVRMPVAPGLLAIEERAFPASRFTELCRELGVTFFDHSRVPVPTADGSHLTDVGADRYSRFLAKKLASLWQPSTD